MRNKSLIVLLVLTMVFGLTALGQATTAKDTLVMANYRDLRDLNPHLYGGEIFGQNLLFEGLVFLDQTGNPTPWLAESWKVSPDGKLYTFKLRDDVSFTDGTKFNAKTAKQNFDTLLENGTRHGWLESIRLMLAVQNKGKEAVRTTGEYTLEIEFAEPYYPFIVELGVTRPFRMISPKCFKGKTSKNGVNCLHGTGSYILKDNTVDEYSEFVANENYWGKKPAIKKIIAKVIPDNQARLIALESGDIDLVYGLNLISPKAYKRFENKKGFGTVMSDPMSTRMMILNTTRPELSDARVRRALQYLTNRQIISDKIMLGMETPAYTLFSKNIPCANIDLEPYKYDPKKAAVLLDEAGWKMDGSIRKKDGKELKITLTYDSDKVLERTIAQYLQSMWGKSGVKMKIVGEEEQAHRDRLKGGDFDISFNISWGTPYDPQSFIGAMRKPVYGDYAAQQGLKEKAQIDQAILDALKSVDIKKRQEHYTYILKTLHEEAVYLPLTYERNRAIFSDKVKDVGFNPSQFEIPLQRMKLQ
ncbi:nickel ABC transporter substrate-binding protein [Maridesulfovibrio zosterae]|uniref:nickel ABC transporter substrate-binding protein n=1 Tax=Maridesulfovibrio zosterae TaxID=82171 RepID=UPI00040EF66E|nr:nickel ABC transporter substrate-binding protein [Maridesulfovibrio zosterae]